MVEGLLEEEDDGEKEEETRGEEEEEEECLPVHRRPVVARDRKTLQRRRRETERKMKVRTVKSDGFHQFLYCKLSCQSGEAEACCEDHEQEDE